MFLNPNIDNSRTALISDNGTKYTYAELEEYAVDIRKILGATKCVVLIMADRSVEVIRFLYACYCNTYVPLVMDEKSDRILIKTLEKQYKFKYIWCTIDSAAQYSGKVIYQLNDYCVVYTGNQDISINEKLAVLMSTSGTTGSSKSVRITYENLLTACQASVEAFNAQKDDVGIVMLPTCYCFGQVYLYVHFIVGATLCVTNKTIFDAEFWTFFSKYRITNFFGVPYTFSQLCRIGFFDEVYPHLRYMCMGGGKTAIDFVDSFLKTYQGTSAELNIIYGQTEAVMISSLATKYLHSKNSSVGVALPNIEVELQDVNDGVGEIVVKGENISMGYAYGWADLALGDVNNHVLYTGDLGKIDSDGCLYIVGRKSRFSKIAGVRIGYDEIERIIKDAFENIEVACVGNDSLISVYYTGAIDSEEIKKFLCKTIRVDKRYIGVDKLESLPRLINGKIDYTYLGSLK